jgi:hypothetical protein
MLFLPALLVIVAILITAAMPLRQRPLQEPIT